MTTFIYLASRSPRRRELLRQIGVRHEVVEVSVDESRYRAETAPDYVVRLALAKARAGRGALPRGPQPPVLAADTAVVVDKKILGKPSNQDDALRMLAMLSGRTHEVYTAVALVDEREQGRLNVSRVRFRQVGSSEALAYWRTGEPADKAGGYGIQGLGAVFVAELDGSFSSVMGLPLFETAALLKEHGIDVLAESDDS